MKKGGAGSGAVFFASYRNYGLRSPLPVSTIRFRFCYSSTEWGFADIRIGGIIAILDGYVRFHGLIERQPQDKARPLSLLPFDANVATHRPGQPARDIEA